MRVKLVECIRLHPEDRFASTSSAATGCLVAIATLAEHGSSEGVSEGTVAIHFSDFNGFLRAQRAECTHGSLAYLMYLETNFRWVCSRPLYPVPFVSSFTT